LVFARAEQLTEEVTNGPVGLLE